jgi:hypothetical protein
LRAPRLGEPPRRLSLGTNVVEEGRRIVAALYGDGEVNVSVPAVVVMLTVAGRPDPPLRSKPVPYTVKVCGPGSSVKFTPSVPGGLSSVPFWS